MSRTRVKFCGLMTPQDARAAAAAGADAVGMILHAEAKRRIDIETAATIVAALPPYVAAVGVYVNAPNKLAKHHAFQLGLTHVQLHDGDETPGSVADLTNVRVVKVFKVNADTASRLALWRDAYAAGRMPNLIGILLDSPAGGGAGEANDFDYVQKLDRDGAFRGLPPVTLAGGLTAENVGDVVRELRPHAVDTSSGIEEEFGTKSVARMRRFIDAVARADATTTI